MSKANLPKFKGLETFKGKWYHTNQWPHGGVDFTAKRVAVVGTGATAVQVIPEVSQQAKQLTVFQRTPAFCVPARNGKVDPEVVNARKADYDGIIERIRNSQFGHEIYFIEKSALEASPQEREREFDKRWDAGGFAFWIGNYQDMFFNQEANDLCADYLKRKIRATVKDPVVAEKLIPKTYPYGTKRQPLDTNYFETFNKANVLLVDAGGPAAADTAELAAMLAARDGQARTLALPGGLSEPAAVITAVARGQQLARSLALAKGADPDSPVGLTKVTQTT